MYVNRYLKDYLKRWPDTLGWSLMILALGFGIYKGYHTFHTIYHVDQLFFTKSPTIKLVIAIFVGLLDIMHFLLGFLWFAFVRSLKGRITNQQFSMLTKMAIVVMAIATILLFIKRENTSFDTIILSGYFFIAILYLWYYANKLLKEKDSLS